MRLEYDEHLNDHTTNHQPFPLRQGSFSEWIQAHGLLLKPTVEELERFGQTLLLLPACSPR